MRVATLGIFFGSIWVVLCAEPQQVLARDFHSPSERPLDGTAYTPEKGQFQFVAELFGVNDDNLFATLGLSYSPSDWFNIGLNVAHLSAGVFNLHSKFNILEKGRLGLGASLGIIYLNGSWIWILPEYLRTLLKGIDAFIIPASIIASLEAARWVHFDLEVEYLHTEVIGNKGDGRLLYDGYFASRMISFRFSTQFYISDRVDIRATLQAPLWGETHEQIEADVYLTDYLHGGVRSAGNKTVSPFHLWDAILALNVELARLVYMGFVFSIGDKTEYLYERNLQTGAKLEWRF